MRQYLEKAADAVKYTRWLTRENLMRGGIFCALLSIVLFAHDAIANPDARDQADFVNYWAGALLAATGRPEVAYDVGSYHVFQQSLVGPDMRWAIYSYPPIMMLLCWPLAGLSMVHAWLVWVLSGIALCAWSLSRPVGWPMAALATIGTPAAFLNLICGQNGYYTAVLLVWGLSLVESRPSAAGILLGILCYKPHLGILLPVALVAGGHWRAFAAAAATVILLVAACTFAFGPSIWTGFLDRLLLERQLLQFAHSTWVGMPTVFVAMRMAGASLSVAYLIQGVSAILAAMAVAALWRGRCALGIKSAALVVGTFLATPYAYGYDTVILIFAAAWLAAAAAKTGFLPWERIAVFTLLTLPALSLLPALAGFQIGPILLWLTMAAILRRGLAYARPASATIVAAAGSAAIGPSQLSSQL
jgi:arabinofuranan 3-O-arabinosyltransferase